MPKEKAVAVEIFNQKYQLATSEKRDSEYIERAAKYLDGKMQSAAKNAGRHSNVLDIAILAALDIAEEVLEARELKESLAVKTDEKLEAIKDQLSKGQDKNDASSSTSEPRF